MNIMPIDPGYREEVDALIKEEWGGPLIVSRGCLWDTSILPGFVAVDDNNSFCGAVTYRISDGECEITTLNSLKEKQGIGSSLVNAVIDTARSNRCRRIWLITTNDNTNAMHFYQKFGFLLKAVHLNVLEKSRQLKPSIPLVGIDGIPLMHEFEFEMKL